MAFTSNQIDALAAKLDKNAVKSRSQAGRTLSYIEGWHAIAEANRIFGFDAWDRSLVSMQLLGEPRLVDGKHRVGYMATVRVIVRAGDCLVARDGTGFGSGIDKDVDQAHESALKEAETDAMKRALMTFGNPFGLALYDKTQENVGASPKPAPAAAQKSDLALDMIERLAGVQTMQQLLTLAKGEEWQGDIAKLSEPDKVEVRKAYAQAQRQLDQIKLAGQP